MLKLGDLLSKSLFSLLLSPGMATQKYFTMWNHSCKFYRWCWQFYSWWVFFLMFTWCWTYYYFPVLFCLLVLEVFSELNISWALYFIGKANTWKSLGELKRTLSILKWGFRILCATCGSIFFKLSTHTYRHSLLQIPGLAFLHFSGYFGHL